MGIRWENMNWESAFFGYPVAQIYPPFNPETLNALIEQLRTGGYVFAYAFCPPPSTVQIFLHKNLPWQNRK
jgi:hypothetical protein